MTSHPRRRSTDASRPRRFGHWMAGERRRTARWLFGERERGAPIIAWLLVLIAGFAFLAREEQLQRRVTSQSRAETRALALTARRAAVDACERANDSRLVLRRIISQSYGDALSHGRVPPEDRARVISQEQTYLRLAANVNCERAVPQVPRSIRTGS